MAGRAARLLPDSAPPWWSAPLSVPSLVHLDAGVERVARDEVELSMEEGCVWVCKKRNKRESVRDMVSSFHVGVGATLRSLAQPRVCPSVLPLTCLAVLVLALACIPLACLLCMARAQAGQSHARPRAGATSNSLHHILSWR